MLGFSANRAIGKLLLNFDLSFSKDIFVDTTDFTNASILPSTILLKKDEIGTSFGFEYAISNEQNVSLGIQARKYLNEDEGLLPRQRLFNDGLFGSWLVRYSNTLLNTDLVISSTLQGDLKGESLLVQVGANYTLNDNWAISSQIISITSDSASPLVFFDEDVRLGATITYSF